MSRALYNRKKHRQNTCKILHSIYEFLKEKSDTIILKKIKCMDGYYDPDVDLIAVDYRKEFLSTLIHEILHSLHPDWCETKVVLTEREIMNTMTVRQCKNVIKRFAAYI